MKFGGLERQLIEGNIMICGNILWRRNYILYLSSHILDIEWKPQIYFTYAAKWKYIELMDIFSYVFNNVQPFLNF